MVDVTGAAASLPAMPAPFSRLLKRIGAVVLAVALATVAWGVVARHRAERNLAARTQDQLVPTVMVIQPQPQGGPSALVLPGNVQALNSAPLYARTNGYVRSWLVDIGAEVNAGQLLATIEAPEVDQQLIAARADLETARANGSLAASTAIRWQGLLEQDAVSKQENDERIGDLAAKRALTSAAAANVARLSALVGFTRIVAPFTGVITRRSVQIGQLVTAGDGGAQPLFEVSDISRVRIYVRVPQAYSGQIAIDEKVSLALPEFPGRTFEATLTRTDGAVDRQSGTVLVELQASNQSGELKPGAYVQARFPTAAAANTVTIPVSAVLFRSDGTLVASVTAAGKIALRPIVIGRDWGETLEVKSGLATSDRVVNNPSDSIADGDPVSVQSNGKQESGAQPHA